jgi:hypothetical protein
VTTPAHLAPRYPVTPQHPPMRVRVAVLWNGRMFKAARVHHPRTKKLCWVTERKSDFSEMYLPPKGRKAEAWGDNPQWWQPEKPEEWKAPLPPPLKFNGVSAEGVMADIGRGARRRRQTEALDAMRDELPWWWQIDPDAARIVYEPTGHVTRDMAEGRVMRAVSASGAQETEGLTRQGVFEATAFAELTAAAQVYLQDETTKREQIKPSKWLARLHLDRADLKDWLTAMAWFAALNPPELRGARDGDGEWDEDDTTRPWVLNDRQKVLIARARCIGGPMSWRSVGEWMGMHHSRPQQLYESAIDRVHRAANGLHVTLNEPVDHMAAVREGNRAFKRGNIYDQPSCEDAREQVRPQDGRPSADTATQALATGAAKDA